MQTKIYLLLFTFSVEYSSVEYLNHNTSLNTTHSARNLGLKSSTNILPSLIRSHHFRIQNCLARTVVKARKCSHITPILRSLHWLKINEPIEYKLLSLTYKSSHNQPTWLHCLLTCTSLLETSQNIMAFRCPCREGEDQCTIMFLLIDLFCMF